VAGELHRASSGYRGGQGGDQFDRAREAVLEVEGGGEIALEVERGREDRVKGLG
jgi:hypothetical protein